MNLDEAIKFTEKAAAGSDLSDIRIAWIDRFDPPTVLVLLRFVQAFDAVRACEPREFLQNCIKQDETRTAVTKELK